MLPLSPALFIAAASALLPQERTVAVLPVNETNDLAECDPLARDNHGPEDGVTTAAFIAHVGYWSHHSDIGVSTWPFALDADCDRLADLAAGRGVLSVSTPDPGAILLRWSMLTQCFTRASIVLWADNVLPTMGGAWTYDCLVIEGSARLRFAGAGSRAGYDARLEWVRRVKRRCCPMLGDRFVSWVDLDSRGETVRVRRKVA